MKNELYIREWLKKGDKGNTGFVTVDLEFRDGTDSYITGGLKLSDGDSSVYFPLYEEKNDGSFEEGTTSYFSGSLEKLDTMISALKKARKFIRLHS